MTYGLDVDFDALTPLLSHAFFNFPLTDASFHPSDLSVPHPFFLHELRHLLHLLLLPPFSL